MLQARARSLQAWLFPHGVADVVRQVLLFAVAYYGYRLVRGGIDDPGGAAVAFENGRHVIHIEQSLGVFVEPGVQGWAATKPVIIDLASWMYINAQFSVTIGSLVFLYLAHNRSFYFVRNMFVVAMAIAILGYALWPTAPPRLFPEWGFTDSVANFTGVNDDSAALSALVNPYAAIPSMHVCFALLIAIPLARLCKHRVARVAWTFYPPLVVFVIVATGNHFLTDAFLGAVTAVLSASTAAWLARARPAVWAFSPARA